MNAKDLIGKFSMPVADDPDDFLTKFTANMEKVRRWVLEDGVPKRRRIKLEGHLFSEKVIDNRVDLLRIIYNEFVNPHQERTTVPSKNPDVVFYIRVMKSESILNEFLNSKECEVHLDWSNRYQPRFSKVIFVVDG